MSPRHSKNMKQIASKHDRKGPLNDSFKALSKVTHKAAFKPSAKPGSRTAEKAAPQATCHFLRVPLEIRRKIYGYLLLDPPHASLNPDYRYDDPQRYFGGMTKGFTSDDEDIDSEGTGWDGVCPGGYGDSEDDMLGFAEFNRYGIEMGDMCDGMFNDLYNNYSPMGFGGDMFDPMDDQRHAMDFGGVDTSSSPGWTDDEDESEDGGAHNTPFIGKRRFPKSEFGIMPKIKRHLAILRANRQIYNEASALLHSDLTIHVCPGDAWTDMPANAIVKPTKKVWRHAPSKGRGFTTINGQTEYNSIPLDGTVEPHVFARFEKVSYPAKFRFDCDNAAPSLYIKDDLSVRSEDAANFVSYLTTAKSTTRWVEDPSGRRFDKGRRETVKDVANITISSITVTQPSTADIIQKTVDLLSNSPLIRHLRFILDVEVRQGGSEYDYEADSVDDATEDEKMEVANERATELFLESGVLNCLRKLLNVKRFSLEVATAGRGDKIMKLQPKHLNIVRDLKKGFELN